MSITMNVFGRLTRNPEQKTSQQGNTFVTLSLAVNHGKNSQGEEEATFIDLTAYGKTAENILKYCQKGSRLSVNAGNVKLEKWVGQNGNSGTSLRGMVQQMDIVDWPENNQQVQPQQPYQEQPVQSQYAGAQQYPVQPQYQQPPLPYSAQPAPMPPAQDGYAQQAAPPVPAGNRPW